MLPVQVRGIVESLMGAENTRDAGGMHLFKQTISYKGESGLILSYERHKIGGKLRYS